MAKHNEVLLGQKAKCVVTGFSGTVTSITELIFGCRRIGIQPPVGEDGKIPESMDIDEPQVEVTDIKQIIKPKFGKPKITLGQECEDTLTGYKGIAYGRCIFLNGCTRYGLQEKYDPTSEKLPCTGRWMYEGQIAIVQKKVLKELSAPKEERRTGGPTTKSIKIAKGKL